MKLKFAVTIFFLIVVAAFGQTDHTLLPVVQVESINRDGSYILIIDGRRYRAFNEKQTQLIGEMQSEMNSYRNDFLECRERLSGSNVGD